MRKMRILLDLTTLSTPAITRGVGRYVSELALALHSEAKSQSALEVLGIGELPLIREPRITSDIPELLTTLSRPHKPKASALWAVGVRLALARAVSKANVNVVHSPDPGATPLGSLQCPRVVTCHHVHSLLSQSEWHGASAGESEREKRRFSRADHIIAISSATANDLIARLNIRRERISIVDNGVNLSRWSPEPGFEDDARLTSLGTRRGGYLLCVGAADERKNVEGILVGLGRARKLTGRADLTLVWAGRLSRTEQIYLEASARQSGVADSVKRVGYVTDGDLAALYRGAVALVFPSLREGFGYPVVEALASGTPVITSQRGSLPYVGGEAALLVDPEDQEAIADAIVLLADDARERLRRSQLGPQVAARFSTSKMAQETILVYERLANVGNDS